MSTSAYGVAVHGCIFTFIRIGISAAQLQAIKPSWRRSSSSGSEQQCSVACLAAVRTCDRTPLDLYLKATGRYHYGRSRVLPFFSSDTNSLSRNSDTPCNDDVGWTSINDSLHNRGTPFAGNDKAITPDSILEGSLQLDDLIGQALSSSAGACCGSSRSSVSSQSNNKSSKRRGRIDLSNYSGIARTSQPKSFRVPNTGHSYRHMRSFGAQSLESICEDAAVDEWQTFNVSLPSPLDPLERMQNALFDNGFHEAAQRFRMEPHEQSRHSVRAASEDKVAVHASRLPILLSGNYSAGPSSAISSSEIEENSIGGKESNLQEDISSSQQSCTELWSSFKSKDATVVF